MKSNELLELLDNSYNTYKDQIDQVHAQGLENSHLIGNKDSQSCVTYPPITKLGKNVEYVYSQENVTKNTLYIHIPFCTGICFYCSYKVKKSIEGSTEIDYYIDYLEKELILILNKLEKEKLDVETIYIGGGTPSILSVKQLQRLLSIIQSKVNVRGEYTLETSPETVSIKKIILAKSFGVNRVSTGVESWNNQILKNINRRHDKQTATTAIDIFRKAGIEDIDVDLIRGLPGQTKEILIEDCVETANLEIPSMTNYQYNIKPQSVDYKKITPQGYNLSAEQLTQYGYFVFEAMKRLGYKVGPPIGWFLKTNSIYQHNNLKWKNQYNQICLGVSSYGYYEGSSFSNSNSLLEYRKLIDQNKLPIVANTNLTKDEIIRRHFIFSLKSNVDINYFKKFYDFDLIGNNDISLQINHLKKIGCLDVKQDSIELTSLGSLFTDQILMTFYSKGYNND